MSKVDINKNLGKALNIIKKKQEKSKKKPKMEMTGALLSYMQEYLDHTEEKTQEFIKVVTTKVDKKTNTKIIDKGIVVYARLIPTIKLLCGLAEKEGIECRRITGSTSLKKRSETEDWFHEDPKGKIVFISDAGGASLNLNPTNEMVLYTIPTSTRKFNQVIGRVARSFGKYDEFNIGFIIVEGTLDEYNKELLGSKSSVEQDLLGRDSIPVTKQQKFNLNKFKKIREKLLWRKK